MARIRVLDERTANQIAAGEVVERPASVVKELVENSLDAGAGRITIEVQDGGKQAVIVTDNGAGMDADDARLSLQRHATSKIENAHDLSRVLTMGFRGEALPAIASVTRFELTTRSAKAAVATLLVVAGGRLESATEVAAPVGTRVAARDLFYNVPARLKFLKKTATELARISETVGGLALAHPEVAFRLLSGGRLLFSTPGSGQVLDAAVAVLGPQTARALLAVDRADATGRVWGFVGRPEAARAGRGQQYFFVNRRPVRAVALRYPLEEAYANLLPQGRYPVAILFIEVQPEGVDVNVHPAKQEVRFDREREVRSLVYRAVREALAAALLIPGAPPAVGRETPAPYAASPRTGFAGSPAAAPPAQQAAAAEPGAWQQALAARAADRWGDLAAAATAETDLGSAASAAPATGAAPGALLAELRPLGQIQASYIVADGPGGLYVIDQHAAHERVFFERFLQAAATAAPVSQPLLFATPLDVTPGQMATWEEHRDRLVEAGFQIEPFGRGTLLLQAVPAELADMGAAGLVSDFLDRLQAEETDPAADPLQRRRRLAAAMAACKAAVKARDALTVADMTALLQDLAACAAPATCPHGRPTVIVIGSGELARRFGRT